VVVIGAAGQTVVPLTMRRHSRYTRITPACGASRAAPKLADNCRRYTFLHDFDAEGVGPRSMP